MADLSGVRVVHGTLTANTVDRVLLPAGVVFVEVLNRGATEVFVSTNGDTPAVEGAEFDCIPAYSSARLGVSHVSNVGTVIGLISTGASKYSVTAGG